MTAFRLIIAWSIALSFATSSVIAQSPGSSNTVTEFKGKLKSFQRGILLVTRDDDKEVMVQLPDDISSFTFVADAKPAFLGRGTLVRFSGLYDANGNPLAPIKKVEIIQPIGPANKLSNQQRQNYVPGVYSQHRGGRQQLPPSATYHIVGNLGGLSPAGAMMVQAGKVSVRAQLAQDAKFEIRFNNLSLAKEGDPVSVAGFYEPPDDTKVKADRITVTTDRVYGEPVAVEKPTRRRGRRDAENDGDKEGDKEEGDAAKKEAGEADADAEGASKEGADG